MAGEVMLCRSVGMKSCDGQIQDGSCLSSPRRPFRGAFVDVTMSLVLTMSSGTNATPAIAAAPMAMPSDDHGYGESITSSPAANPPTSPGSGALRTAERKLLAQFSNVRSRALYINVAFVPFHTPHTPSFVHNAPITSNSESERLRASWCGPGASEGSGKTYPARSVTCFSERPGECGAGVEEVKYAGSSGSESSEGNYDVC